MQIVIDIDDAEYEIIKAYTAPMTWAEHLIAKGKTLPKGHGRLIDISDIEPMSYTVDGGDYYDNYKAIDWEDIENAPIIIEADKEEEA